MDELDNSCPIDLLVLPRVSAELGGCSEPARSTSLLSDVVGMPATSPASDMGTSAASLSEGGRSFSHEPDSSRALNWMLR